MKVIRNTLLLALGALLLVASFGSGRTVTAQGQEVCPNTGNRPTPQSLHHRHSTSTNTPTQTPTQTATKKYLDDELDMSTPTQTPTQTATQEITDTPEPTPTATQEITDTPEPTPTGTLVITNTPNPTATPGDVITEVNTGSGISIPFFLILGGLAVIVMITCGTFRKQKIG